MAPRVPPGRRLPSPHLAIAPCPRPAIVRGREGSRRERLTETTARLDARSSPIIAVPGVRDERGECNRRPATERPETERPPIDTTLERWERERSTPPAAGFVAARLARERTKAGRLLALETHPVLRHRSPHRLVPRALALAGLGGRARANARKVAVVRRTLELPSLPPAFEGFRLLHVSDPHFGADATLDDAILASVSGIEHDLCVMTGDYRYRSHGPFDTAIERLAALMESLGADASGEAPLAVLGNHDSIEMVPPMEALGIRVLLNERVTLRRGDAALHVVGIDDPRYYRLDDLSRALGTPEENVERTAGEDESEHVADPARSAVTLLLAHSPERADAASAAGCDAYLCGHTHGGQVCLPGGRIVMRNARAPLERLSGAWRVDGMRGYTSRGVGVSIAAARFHCPPELTLHVFARGR